MGIEKDQVGRALCDLLKGFLTVPSPKDLVVVDAEKCLQEVQILLLIVYDQDARLSFFGETAHWCTPPA
jgi:hypothetical protein